MNLSEEKMKIGNISQTVLRRSVLKQLKHTRKEVLASPTKEETCIGIETKGSDAVISSSTTVFGDEKDLGVYGVIKVINDIASRNARAIAVEAIIQLPPYAYESRLKTMVSHMESCCEEVGVEIAGIKVSVNPVITSAIIYVTGIGHANIENILWTSQAKPNRDIVLLNTVGQEGALRILDNKKEQLEERFIASFFAGLNNKSSLIVKDSIQHAIEKGACAVHQIGEGGILAALWELGEAANIGLELDIKMMSIQQETIEICEFVGLNPYQLSSIGSVLIVIDDGSDLVDSFRKQGHIAEVIGRTTSDTERVILNGDEKRFLDRPIPDELLKLYQVQGE